jgi:hypothetical protein
MKIKSFSKPFFRFTLIFLVFFLSAGALYGGLLLIIDPSGGGLRMPLSALADSPFPDYLIPGLILFISMGLFPLTLVYALVTKPAWKWAGCLNIYKDRHWSWTYSLYVSIMLVIWIDIEILFLGYGAFIQTFYALLGILMIIVTLIPSNIDYYTEKDIMQQPGNPPEGK